MRPKTTLLGGLLLVLTAGLSGCDESDDDVGSTDAVEDDTGLVTTEELSDPLSMPLEPTLELSSFQSATDCIGCHPNHVAQWQLSMHSYAMVDPVFRGLVRLRQETFEGNEDRFCTQCHSALGVRSGDIAKGFDFDELDPLTLEGITCESCHKVAALERNYNSGHVFDPDGPMRATISDPIDSQYHDSAYSELHGKADFCSGCHDVIEKPHDLPLERPFQEWLESPAGEAGKPCQACHMPTYQGPAAAGGPIRTVHEHNWVGVDIPLLEGHISPAQEAELEARVEKVLESAGRVDLAVPAFASPGGQIDVVVTVTNLIDGHNLPTGSTFTRQCWIELTATDAEGRVLYRTGHLDDNGDLRNFWSALDPFGDPDLITIGSTLIDDDGDPVVFTWEATEHFSNAISPLHSRTWTLFVPVPSEVAGPITVEAALRFRSFPPFVMRLLGLDDLLPRVKVRTIDAEMVEVDLK